MAFKAFWNNGAYRVVRVGSLDRVTGRFIGKNPDPSIDLYDYEEVKPTLSEYEILGPKVVAFVNGVIRVTYDSQSMAVEAVKASEIRKVKSRRDQVINAGIYWLAADGNTYIVQTDADSRRELIGAVVGLNETSGLTQIWRMKDNVLVSLPSADFKAMAIAVRDHVNACYVRQAELEAAVAGGIPYDISAGWPAHYTASESV